MKANCCLWGMIGTVTSLPDSKIHELEKADTMSVLLCGMMGAVPAPSFVGAETLCAAPSQLCYHWQCW